MKVVSMVPSWTEMLLEAGVNVVGRTRFCIHPRSHVETIPPVGGTKDLDWDKLKVLEADLLILDQEENLPWMKEQSPIATLVTHVTSIENLPGEIAKLSQALGNEQLMRIQDRWLKISGSSRQWDWHQIPAELQRIRCDHSSYEKLVYMIWKDPWMSVSKRTFIGSVLSHLGAEVFLPDFEAKYPEIRLEDFDIEKTYFLFSSEPFPFHKKVEELQKLNIHGSIIDGESFSWFGTRVLRFLEAI